MMMIAKFYTASCWFFEAVRLGLRIGDRWRNKQIYMVPFNRWTHYEDREDPPK